MSSSTGAAALAITVLAAGYSVFVLTALGLPHRLRLACGPIARS